eukprot:TRINITY_DN19838_c1_g2_i1.p1 TRINITY_DN19838_c1_g2~~TRINITY_DN19838_c1_g2_i1.p1  ORF type:complete len:842 (-),score=100.48 TRINITY_DN19838_c1_g2_i1:95-2563(-)
MKPGVAADDAIEARGDFDDALVLDKHEDQPRPRIPWIMEQDLLFMDVEAMRTKVREAKAEPVYSVSDYYHDSGIWQQIARSSLFDNASLLVVALNAIWIAVETDTNKADMLCHAHLAIQVVEHVFCALFSIELAIRAMAFKRKVNALRDPWFLFDFVLVTMMILETWVWSTYMCVSTQSGARTAGSASTLRLIRLLRLTRMARMAKLLRALPELMIMIKGMVAAMRSVFFTLCLLVISIYVFAIAVTQLSEGTESGGSYFSSVLHSMYTLLIRATLLDSIGKLLSDVSEDSAFVAAVIIVFVFVAAFTVMNMLIGVLCEVVSAVAVVEREEMAVNNVNDKLKIVMDGIDSDGNQLVSKYEFKQIVENPAAIAALQAVDVDVVGLVEMADVIFASEPGDEDDEKLISFEEFVELALQMRNTNQATVKDILYMQKMMKMNHYQVAAAFELNDARLARIEEGLSLLTKAVVREDEPTPFPWRMQKKRTCSKLSSSDGDAVLCRGPPSPSERGSPESCNSSKQVDGGTRAHARATRSAGAAISHMVGAISNLAPWSRDDSSPVSQISTPRKDDSPMSIDRDEASRIRQAKVRDPLVQVESSRSCTDDACEKIASVAISISEPKLQALDEIVCQGGTNSHCKRPSPLSAPRKDDSPMSFDRDEPAEANQLRQAKVRVDLESGRSCADDSCQTTASGANSSLELTLPALDETVCQGGAKLHRKRPAPLWITPGRQRPGLPGKQVQDGAADTLHRSPESSGRQQSGKSDQSPHSQSSKAEKYTQSCLSTAEGLSPCKRKQNDALERAEMLIPGTPGVSLRSKSLSSWDS